jgi:hypothetical protein
VGAAAVILAALSRENWLLIFVWFGTIAVQRQKCRFFEYA